MNGPASSTRAVEISARLYAVMLTAYPARFREQYGAEMLQVFRDSCMHMTRAGGTEAMIGFWLKTLLDFIGSMLEQHAQKETYMTQDRLVRIGGWALMLAGVSLMLFLVTTETVQDNWSLFTGLIVTSTLLLAVGLLGLRSAYGRQTGILGRNLLLIGAIAGPISFLVAAPLLVASGAEEWAWLAVFGSPALPLACLAVFGLLSLGRPAMAGARVPAILGGAWYLPIVLIAAVLEGYRPYQFMDLRSVFYQMIWIAFAIQMVSLLVLGHNVQRVTSPQPAMA